MFRLPKPISENLKLIEIILVPLVAMSIPLAIQTKVKFRIEYLDINWFKIVKSIIFLNIGILCWICIDCYV
jgi:hypothetical protein